MREIKFRVYNSNRNEMCYLLENRWSFGPFEGVRSLSWEDVFAEQYEGLIPLQYTGLKDKNGKEIYEGDIVKWTKRQYTDCSQEELESEEHYTGSIYWKETMWGLDTNDGFGYMLMPYYIESDEFEVIGNVYENSDLL